MPIACDVNGFQIANSSMVKTELSIALYAFFVLGMVGLIIGALLLAKKQVPIGIDWVILLICSGCFLIPFFINIKQVQYQTGAYVIIAGLAVYLVFLIAASVKGEESNSSINSTKNRKCRQCGKIYTTGYICPQCGSSLYEETNENADGENKIG
jgi:hypothetical protein